MAVKKPAAKAMTTQNQKLSSALTVTRLFAVYGPSMVRLGRDISRGNLRVDGLDSVMAVFQMFFAGLFNFVLLDIAE